MPNINHQVAIQAEPKKVYELIATKAGIQQWLKKEEGWKITGPETTGETLVFDLYGDSHQMKIIKQERNKEIKWECVAGPDEWLETTVDFLIEDKGDKCILYFEHAGWAAITPFFEECDQAWRNYIAAIKAAAGN